MNFELTVSIIALVISGFALIVSIKQSNLAKTSNRLALRKDYVDNYNLVSRAFGEWSIKVGVSDEFRNLISEALRHSKLLLTDDITKFLEGLHNNIFVIYRANIYITGKNDNLELEAIESWNQDLTAAKEKYKRATDEINGVVFNKELTLIERHNKYTQLPDTKNSNVYSFRCLIQIFILYLQVWLK